jgi:hypothetical protein
MGHFRLFSTAISLSGGKEEEVLERWVSAGVNG